MSHEPIHTTIARHASVRPSAIAVRSSGESLTYGDLDARAELVAAALRQLGAGPNRMVAIAMARGLDLIVAALGVLKSGAAYLPIDPSYPLERQAFMLADAQPVALLSSQDHAKALPEHTCPVLWVDALPSVDAAPQVTPASLDDLAYVIYTSGSTGKPKGCLVTHGNVARLFSTTQPSYGFDEHDTWSFFHSFSFDFSVWEIWGALVHGGCVVVVPFGVSRSPDDVLQLLIDEQVTVLSQTPAAFRNLIASDTRQGEAAGKLSLRWVFLGGEALDVQMLKPWFARHPDNAPALINGYGPTETTVFATFKAVKAADTLSPQGSNIGTPIADLQAWVLNDALQPVTDGDAGELFIGGPGVSRGYLNRPELTAERFIDWVTSDGAATRLYRTGDLVSRRPDGQLDYQGRRDTQVKIRGFRIEIGEIESQLAVHPGVQAAAVVAWPASAGGDARLVAYVVPVGAPVPVSSLREHLAKVVPDFMVPEAYVSISALPLTDNGKVDRRALPAPGRQRPELATDYVAPATPVEARLCEAYARVLDIDQVGTHDNFFELGGSSLKVLRLIALVNEQASEPGAPRLRVADVYDRLTPSGLASLMGGTTPLRGARTRPSAKAGQSGQIDEGIAIVGMALRVPGANDVEAFWANLLAGRDGIRHFALHELDPSVPEEMRRNPHFVAARGVIEQPGRFDAAFFGIPQREATIMDPQQRQLLELSWAALEHAGIDPTKPDSLIGAFAGTAQNTYLPALRDAQPELIAQYGEFQTMLASEKDYPAIRVAYRLNLHGPAISVHTACSTGLVAVAQACQALWSGQCDAALAGGATVVVPQESGYLHVEGAMESADGLCRPFDAAASGTVFSSGAAVVVLKRLADAVADGDTVYAVIKGLGVNNDGGDKASFTAPSVSGQAQAVRMALDNAGVSARQIGYVEAHGTGTPLGDPIEVAALVRAWAPDTADTGFCTLGSAKGNVGHMVAAAGVAGLIKAALALHRERIPGTVHYREANPQLGLDQTPFVLSATDTPWPRQSGTPRMAAVSSFGVGGTNAHVILQEGPLAQAETCCAPAGQAPATWLLPLSARSPKALPQRAADLAAWLTQHPETPLSEVAATLMKGRSAMPWRQAVVASTSVEAIAALTALAQAKPPENERRNKASRLVFLYPGQGAQHPGMAAGLYEAEPAFRDALDRCFTELATLFPAPWQQWLVEAAPTDEAVAQALSETRHAQVALFCVSYALGTWLDSLGIQPAARIGHSVGEWAAACQAGVFTLPDALRAVVARGAAMQAQPRGAMLAVRASAETTRALLPNGVELAGLNAPTLTVVAGPAEAIDQTQALLDAQQIAWTRLKVSHAFHSASMDGALPVFEAAVSALPARAPSSLVYSSLSGEPLSAEQATSPAYWAQQVRGAVRFSQAIEQELAKGPVLFVEVGSGQALSALVRQHRIQGAAPRVVSLLGPAAAPGQAVPHALGALGQLWSAGIDVAWPIARHARRAVLPTYPFQGETHWFARRATPVSAPIPNIPASDLTEAPKMSRLPTLQTELKRILSEVSGVPPDELQDDDTLMDQGLDSLSLTQATLELDRSFGIKLRFRRLMEDLDTIGKLATFLDAELPADRFAPPAPPALAVAPQQAAPMQAEPFAAAPVYAQPALPPFAPAPSGLPVQGMPAHLVTWQIQLIEQQLQLLKAMVPSGLAPAALPLPAMQPGPVAAPVAPQAAPVNAQPASAAKKATALSPVSDPAEAQPSSRSLVEKPFGASARITLKPQEDMNAAQQAWLGDFIQRYNGKSGASKAYAQRYRDVMADPRVVTGFNPLWKDLVYPLVVNRSKGNRMWDLDQNEYIDLLSCFGANLLGYQPDDITEALIQQVKAGFEVGPQHELAGEVAELMAEFTGHERVAFCNTGSEAVMGAMRMARTVTGRKTIAIFANSYHGIFDEVIVRGTRQLRSLSAAPGILASAVENVLVLDYGSDEALKVIRERGHELAAVLIEPIQSRNLDLRPQAFVRELRELCTASGAALIFDEVITGFRVALGGAQAYYGVRADIATYGKVVGGGIPFAVIAGKRLWMDALDGGTWQFGDDSYPEAGVTYFAGTFVRHPLALAAARASLLHLKKSGPALQETLNARTTALAQRLNEALVARGAPAKAVHFSSVWRLVWDEDQRFVSLFYYLLRFHGLHVYEQFGHFMTEAFTEADFDRLFHTYIDALDELMALGLIRPRAGPPGSGGPGGGGGLPAGERGKAFVAAPAITTGVNTGSNSPDGIQAGARAPLTPGQTERWLATRFDAAARRAINETLCLSLDGEIDTTALRDAVVEVAARHHAFRLAFDPDEPVQVLQAPAAPPVEVLDLAAQHPPTMVDAALAAFYDQASHTDFDIEHAPLARLTVIKLAPQRHVVHLVTSHLVFDGWATSVFVDELSAVLAARQQGLTPALPPAESPLDFAQTEEARMDGPEGQADLRWWTDALRDPPPPLPLADRAPPAQRLYAADTVRARIEPALLTALKATARQHKATLFQILLAALGQSLREASGHNDMVVSIPYAVQSLGDHPALLADGVLDLPLRLRIDPQATGSQWIASARASLMDASEHPLMTQGTVARALGLPSRGDRPPLTGVFFNLNPRVDLSALARLPRPLKATLGEAPKRGSLNELFFNFYDAGDHLSLDLHHSTELFSPLKAQALVDGLLATCIWLSQTPQARLPEPTAPQAPAAQAAIDPRLLAWNDTAQAWPNLARVEELVSRQASRTPAATALLAQGHSLSYAELENRANQIAHVLRERGARPGHFVGLCLGRGPWLLPALLGVLKTGAAYVPLDPGFPVARLRYMAQDAELALLVTESAHADLIELPRAQQLRVDDDLAQIEQASASAFTHTEPLPLDAPAYAIYTSGSTGQPKGVVVPQGAVANFLLSMRREPGLHAGDHLLAVTTLSFDIAVLELLLPLTVGARTVLVSRDDAADGAALRHWVEAEGITVMQATPTTWHVMLDAGWRAPAGFKALVGGEPLPPSLAQSLIDAGAELWNMYGPTETTVWSTTARIDHTRGKLGIGRPIANTSVWVLDEQGQPAPVGTAGELCIGGHGVALGYHHQPALTAERFLSDPFSAKPGARLYRTGDLALWREDGQLEHLGRLDHQVKVRGYRIELGEIEAQLASLPGVARCVVVAREDQPGQAQLVAYLVARTGAELDPTALREQLRATLPDYMVPQHHVLLDALPLLPNGKIDRKALPAPQHQAPSVTPGEAAQGPLEAAISGHMAELLGLPEVGRHAHFFELGGHSLLAAKLSARLARATGQRLGLKVLFEHPSAASLAAYIESQQAPAHISIPTRPDQSRAPLSLMQQRLWFIENLQPGGVADNLPSGHRLRGPLNVGALEQALQAMVDQQASLRTRIRRTDTDAEQEVLPSLQLSLQPLTDLSHLPADEAERRAFAAMDILVRTPFRLETGPLFRCQLFRLGQDDHVLFFMTHHLIWDGWSFDLMYEHLARNYPLLCEGLPLPLEPLPLSYGDFSAWQHNWLQGAELAAQLKPWVERFTPPPAPLELPTDKHRPGLLTPEGGSCQINIPRAQLDRLHALAQSHGTTLYNVLLTAFTFFVNRLSQQSDFVIGTPVRGREGPELEGIMGFFVNLLPLRMQVDPNQRFDQLLGHVKTEVAQALSCPDVPMEHLVRALKLPRDLSRSPLVQVLFSFQDVRDRPTHWGAVQHSRFDLDIHGSAQDLGLWCVETGHHLEAVFIYNLHVFTVDTVNSMAQRFAHLVDQIAADGSGALLDYDLLGRHDKARLAQWNSHDMPLPAHETIHALIALQASITPGAKALVSNRLTLSYGELLAQAQALAATLQAHGVAPGQLVGLCCPRDTTLLVGLLGILLSGAGYVPLDPAFPGDRLRFMVQDAGIHHLVCQQDTAAAWQGAGLNLVRADQPDKGPSDWRPPSIDPARDCAYVIYTSGSTGLPKGVRVAHRTVVNLLQGLADPSFEAMPTITPQDRVLAVTTLSFDIAVSELIAPLTVGACIVLANEDEVVDGHALRTLVESSQVSFIDATPSTWRLLRQAGWPGSAQVTGICTGEPLPADLAADLLPRLGALWNGYGPTETTVWSTFHRLDSAQTPVPIGRPVCNTQIHILDEDGQQVPVGTMGELYIGGDGVTLGYLGRDDLTAERFLPDPFRSEPGARLYRTGDLGRWREDGILECLGRIDHQIKVRGYRIEPGEIEAQLCGHPAIAQAVVIAREDTPGDVRLVAYIVMRGEAPTTQAMREHLRQHLPEYMLPQHLVPLDAIPLLPNGKINRAALPVPVEPSAAAAQAAPMQGGDPLRTETERALAAVWTQLLGVSGIRPDDNFFDLGGHSLLTMQAITMMEKTTGKRVTPRRYIFESLAQLAASYDDTPQLAGASDIPVSEAAGKGPSLVRRLFGLARRS